MTPSTEPNDAATSVAHTPEMTTKSRSTSKSLVSISSDDGHGSSSVSEHHKGGGYTDDRDNVAASKRAPSSGGEDAAGQGSKKRPAESQPEAGEAKKAKTSSEESSSGKETAKPKKPNDPEVFDKAAYYDIKDRANAKIKIYLAQIEAIKTERDEAKTQLSEANEKISELEEEDDAWRVEALEFRQKEKERKAKKKTKETEHKAHMKNMAADIRSSLNLEFDEQLADKAEKIEKKLKGQLTAKGNDIKGKQEKIEKLEKTVKQLKTDHKEEIRELKEELREANKLGAPKAREQLKEKDADLKDALEDLREAKQEKISLLSQINNANSRINAAETHAGDCEEALSNTHVDLNKASSDLDTWKSRCVQMVDDIDNIQEAHVNELKKVREEGDRKLREVAAKANAGIQFQRTAYNFRKQNDLNNEWREQDKKTIEELMGDHKRLQEALTQADVGLPEGLKWKAGAPELLTGVEKMLKRVSASSNGSQATKQTSQLSPAQKESGTSGYSWGFGGLAK